MSRNHQPGGYCGDWLMATCMTALILAVIASFVALLLGYLAVGLQRILKILVVPSPSVCR